MDETPYATAQRMIAAADTRDALMAVAKNFTLSQFSGAEDAELTRAFHERWAEIKRTARQAKP